MAELKSQIDFVRHAMSKGEWWTLPQLENYVSGFCGPISGSGLTARIRELRSCGYDVEKEKIPNSKQYRYRAIPRTKQGRLF